MPWACGPWRTPTFLLTRASTAFRERLQAVRPLPKQAACGRAFDAPCSRAKKAGPEPRLRSGPCCLYDCQVDAGAEAILLQPPLLYDNYMEWWSKAQAKGYGTDPPPALSYRRIAASYTSSAMDTALSALAKGFSVCRTGSESPSVCSSGVTASWCPKWGPTASVRVQ